MICAFITGTSPKGQWVIDDSPVLLTFENMVEMQFNGLMAPYQRIAPATPRLA